MIKEVKNAPLGGAEQSIKLSDLDNFEKRLRPNDIKDYTVKWLMDGFILQNTLISFYAMPGNGKSILALHLSLELLRRNVISKVYYIDADNGFATLKNRRLDAILNSYPSLIYYSFAKKAKDDIDRLTIARDIAKTIENENSSSTLVIFDSIRNFIGGNMNYDNEVMPILNDLQKIRDYSAGVWFLHHQNKQGMNDESINNKAFKGSTAFLDSPDEAFFVRKVDRTDNKITLVVEPMKQRDDTTPQAIIIDTDFNSIEFVDYDFYSLDYKEAQSLEYAKIIISNLPNGINLKELVKKIKDMAKTDGAEICGDNKLKNLLKRFASKAYAVLEDKNSYRQLIFKPLI